MTTYWVSFATHEKFLGVAIVDLDNEHADASDIIKEIIARGCNPGDGSMQAQIIPAREIPDRFGPVASSLLADQQNKHSDSYQ